VTVGFAKHVMRNLPHTKPGKRADRTRVWTAGIVGFLIGGILTAVLLCSSWGSGETEMGWIMANVQGWAIAPLEILSRILGLSNSQIDIVDLPALLLTLAILTNACLFAVIGAIIGWIIFKCLKNIDKDVA
jgi:hypothetical protein